VSSCLRGEKSRISAKDRSRTDRTRSVGLDPTRTSLRSEAGGRWLILLTTTRPITNPNKTPQPGISLAFPGTNPIRTNNEHQIAGRGPLPDSNPVTDLLDPLLRHVAERITPLFEIGGADKEEARTTAISALAAYDPRSRADFVNIARILAFSMASLAALGLAADDGLSPTHKMRYFGRANALNRSADQTERIMMQRRRGQHAGLSAPATTGPDPDIALTPQHEAILDAAIEEAMALYQATVTPTAAKPEPQTARPHPKLAETALHTSGANPRPATLYRQNLLHGSAMPRVIDNLRQPPPPS
jgi:hypothetical protein